jgi:hypothetical protein
LQGRHKAILCQSDRYLYELVRYIHLNPVRAKMVDEPEQYHYSGHRAYLGLEPAGIVDVETVLRHFGAKKHLARQAYRRFVTEGRELGHQEELYLGEEGRILGSEEFVDATIHRIGETCHAPRINQSRSGEAGRFMISRLMGVIEKVCHVPREEFCGSGKSARVVLAKEMLILTGCQLGASLGLLGEITALSSGSVSRRHDAAKSKMHKNSEFNKLVIGTLKEYQRTND